MKLFIKILMISTLLSQNFFALANDKNLTSNTVNQPTKNDNICMTEREEKSCYPDENNEEICICKRF